MRRRQSSDDRGGGGQAAADPLALTDVNWADSGIFWTEVNVARPDQPRPFVTYSRFLNPDPQNRAGHVETSRWDGSQWITTPVVRDLAGNPWATAAAYQQVGVENDLIHAWRNQATAEIEWQAMDSATGAMIGQKEDFAAPFKAYPPGLRVRSDGNPAFTFFDNPAGCVAGMYYARWDDLNGVLVNPTLPSNCADAHAPIRLRADDRFVTTCATGFMGAGRDVRLVYEDASFDVQDVVVFGDNDPDNWGEPDVAIAGDTVVVAAYNRTDNEVWTRVKVGASPWQAPRKLLAFDPLIAANGAVLAVAARQHQSGLLHSVLARHESGVWYAEHRPKGAQPAPTRTDLYHESFGDVCGMLPSNVDIFLPDDDDAWLNWQVERGGVNQPVVATRFTAFRRDDQRNFSEDPVLERPHEPTTLSMDPDGDSWHCFFDEDPGGPPKLALFLQHRDDAPILVDDDTGVTAGQYGRGCDVAADADGVVHVVSTRSTPGSPTPIAPR